MLHRLVIRREFGAMVYSFAEVQPRAQFEVLCRAVRGLVQHQTSALWWLRLQGSLATYRMRGHSKVTSGRYLCRGRDNGMGK